LRQLTLRELAGVIAHEISHIRNNDMSVMGLADLVSRMTNMLALFGQLLVVVNLPLYLLTGAAVPWLAIGLLMIAPTITALLQLALSRTREFDADLGAVALTGDPQGLASALARLESQRGSLWERVFLPGRREPEPSLLRTHPRTEERIERLLELSREERPQLVPGVMPVDTIFLLPNHYPEVRRTPRWHIGGLWH
jgi:heat shock protein HtpX